MKNKRLEERRKHIPKDVDLYVERSFQIVDRIHQILTEQGIDQKTLAKALGKSESEISKWMTGTHNFTLKSLSKIEAVLGQPVIEVPGKRAEEEKFVNIDNYFFTWQEEPGRKKTYQSTEQEFPYAQLFQEPSELLS